MGKENEMQRYGRTFERTSDGGWLEVGATLPDGSTARIMGDAVVFNEAARKMYGGVFHGGEFRAALDRANNF